MAKLTAAERRGRKLQEYREQRDYEHQDRIMAIITEFGGRKPEGRMLIPEEDPANDAVKLRLADEVLFLRGQLQRLAKVMELVQTGKPFALIPPGPHWKSGPHALGSQQQLRRD
jgi:hypothetical protein